MLKHAIILISAFLFGYTPTAFSQEQNKVMPGKYTIIFPIDWKRERKLMMRLNALLEYAFKELNDKQFCLKCNGEYYVKVNINHFTITGRSFGESIIKGISYPDFKTYDGIIFYKAKTSLRLYDYNNNPIADLIISTPNEEFIIKRKFEIGFNQDPFSATYFSPDEADLLKMMEEKIWKIKVPKQ